jgi:nucleotidyltransferase substrate binding protein (TIGR01987 family)
MKLDYSVLQNAIERLGESIVFTQKAKQDGDAKIYSLGRTSCIKSFEFCYELACKMLRRHLEVTEHSENYVDTMTFPNLLKFAAERGIISEPLRWLEYRKDRNKTVHGYNEEVAEDIYCDIDTFFADVQVMLDNMKARHDAH